MRLPPKDLRLYLPQQFHQLALELCVGVQISSKTFDVEFRLLGDWLRVRLIDHIRRSSLHLFAFRRSLAKDIDVHVLCVRNQVLHELQSEP